MNLTVVTPTNDLLTNQAAAESYIGERAVDVEKLEQLLVFKIGMFESFVCGIYGLRIVRHNSGHWTVQEPGHPLRKALSLDCVIAYILRKYW